MKTKTRIKLNINEVERWTGKIVDIPNNNGEIYRIIITKVRTSVACLLDCWIHYKQLDGLTLGSETSRAWWFVDHASVVNEDWDE